MYWFDSKEYEYYVFLFVKELNFLISKVLNFVYVLINYGRNFIKKEFINLDNLMVVID